ncbi:MAG TPA: glucosamine-6-phosphate deaminase, partial [Chitinophagaceae bacterium]|nr:glucosamine-6-phosphate deaminase [Chitinophagaceae bacterium]
MKLRVFPNYQALSAQAADEIISLVKDKPKAVLCLASGDTPRLTCKLLAERAILEKVDFRNATFIGLDEWVGIPPENKGSCHYFFKQLLLGPMRFSKDQVHLFDALSTHLQKECREMDEFILSRGGIDLMLVGIGMNGHIGFNEPGSSFDNYSHVADLDETTVRVGQKYFSGPMELEKGITIGLKHLMESRKLILMANGINKAGVISKATEGTVNATFPASVVQLHAN